MPLPVKFIDYASSFMMKKYQAELYENIYPWAAEDFRAVSDCMTAHQNITLYAQANNQTHQNTSQTFNSHTHVAPTSGGPTTPPASPMFLLPPAPPALPFNTTATIDNIGANRAIPSIVISYIDLSTKSYNRPITFQRRQLRIPINATLTPPLIKTE